jgi:hypothetical protein
VLDVRRNRIATIGGLGRLSELKSLIEVRFHPQDEDVRVEEGLSGALESVPRDGGRTLHEFQRTTQEPLDEDNDDEDEAESELAIVGAVAQGPDADLLDPLTPDPLTPPIEDIIAQTSHEPSQEPSHGPHLKQREVGGRVHEMIKRSLLEQLRRDGARVDSLGEVFDDFELVVAVPELNSLFNQTVDRLEGFAGYYLSTRGQHMYSNAPDGELPQRAPGELPRGAVFKVGPASRQLHQQPPSALSQSTAQTRRAAAARQP